RRLLLVAALQGVGRKVPASDGNRFLERPAFAWTRSVVSLATESATALEYGVCHFLGGLSNCRNLEPDAGRGDSVLAIYSQQRCFQWLHGSPPDLGGHAAGHPRATRLAARQMNLNATINGPICVSNPKGILSQSPGLRGTSYPGCIVREVSNPNSVVSFCSRRCAATPLGLKHQSNRVPRVVASLQPWALLRSPFGANRGTPRSVSTPTPA